MSNKQTATSNWHTPCWGNPPIFRNDQDAVQWAIGQGAFNNETEAAAAFTALQQRQPYSTWAYWLTQVGNRLAQQGKGTPTAQKAPAKTKRPVKAN